MNNIIVTVVTVCRNAEKTIKKTIESVLAQTYEDFEYIVIDGASEDKTYEIVCGFDEKFKKRNICFTHISEPDNGIYDAMNKAADMAKGVWINYMNADDMFHSETILKDVFNNVDNSDVIYGDTLRIKDSIGVIQKSRSPESIYKVIPFCHQSAFVKTKIMKTQKFDVKFKIAADYKFFLNVYIAGGRFQHINKVISDYSLEGLSSNEMYKTYIENVEIKHELRILDKYSLKQKLKNIYFKIVFADISIHPIIAFIDAKLRKNS